MIIDMTDHQGVHIFELIELRSEPATFAISSFTRYIECSTKWPGPYIESGTKEKHSKTQTAASPYETTNDLVRREAVNISRERR